MLRTRSEDVNLPCESFSFVGYLIFSPVHAYVVVSCIFTLNETVADI